MHLYHRGSSGSAFSFKRPSSLASNGIVHGTRAGLPSGGLAGSTTPTISRAGSHLKERLWHRNWLPALPPSSHPPLPAKSRIRNQILCCTSSQGTIWTALDTQKDFWAYVPEGMMLSSVSRSCCRAQQLSYEPSAFLIDLRQVWTSVEPNCTACLRMTT